MMLVDAQLNIVMEKLQQLLKQYSRLQKENEQLRLQLQNSKEEQAMLQQNAEAAQQQIAILKAVSGNMSEHDKKDLEKQIGQYIKEIDKCIAFLST